MDQVVLEGTVDTYNQAAQKRRGPPVREGAEVPPCVAARAVLRSGDPPATVCLTSTGLRIDPDAHVLNQANQPIPGLYAAGETTGGVLGERYMGSGNSLSNDSTMGRIAGTHAIRNSRSW